MLEVGQVYLLVERQSPTTEKLLYLIENDLSWGKDWWKAISLFDGAVWHYTSRELTPGLDDGMSYNKCLRRVL